MCDTQCQRIICGLKHVILRSKDDFKIEVKFSKFSAWLSSNGALRQNTLDSFSSSVLNFQA